MSANHIRSSHGILVFKNKHPALKSLQKSANQPSLHGHQVWQSSFKAMEFLLDNPIENDGKVIEIGCGWGLLGIFCAKQFSSRVLLTDADEDVFPYLNAHLELNDISADTEHIKFQYLRESQLIEHDVIVGSDICFWPDMLDPLKRLIDRAMKNGVRKIILSDPGRVSFMKLAEYCREKHRAVLTSWGSTRKAQVPGYILMIENLCD